MSNRKRVTQLQSSARRGQSRQNRQRRDPQMSDIRRRIRHNEGRESTPFLTGKSFCVYVLPKFTDAMPPIKRVVPLFHSITTPTKPSSQRGRSTSIQLARTARGNAVLHGGEPRGPRRVGCWRVISQARETPPVSAQQTTLPIRLTPSDHSGCNAGPPPGMLVQVPDPSVDSQG